MIAPLEVDRDTWGARAGLGSRSVAPRALVVVHHSHRPALKPGDSLNREAAAVRAIEGHHFNENGWSGIGYNFLVTPGGNVFDGRGWGRIGAHARGHNSASYGLCLLQDGEKDPPTPAALYALRWIILEGIRLGYLEPGPEIVGHRDVGDTACPGAKVYPALEELRLAVAAAS